MSRIQTIDPKSASGRSKELLDGVQSKLGMTPNMMRAMANSPAVLSSYLQFSATLGEGELSPATREQIALTVGQQNSCDYCLGAHSTVGKLVGLTSDQIADARRATAADSKTAATLKFASLLVEKRGFVSDEDVAAVRAAGAEDGEIAEIVANTALNLFTNYFNHVAEVEVDFPAAAPLEPAVESCSSCEV